jgi:hypothetical protein
MLNNRQRVRIRELSQIVRQAQIEIMELKDIARKGRSDDFVVVYDVKETTVRRHIRRGFGLCALSNTFR